MHRYVCGLLVPDPSTMDGDPYDRLRSVLLEALPKVSRMSKRLATVPLGNGRGDDLRSSVGRLHLRNRPATSRNIISGPGAPPSSRVLSVRSQQLCRCPLVGCRQYPSTQGRRARSWFHFPRYWSRFRTLLMAHLVVDTPWSATSDEFFGTQSPP